MPEAPQPAPRPCRSGINRTQTPNRHLLSRLMGDGALAWVSTPIRWIGVLTGCFCIVGVGAGMAVAITNREQLAEMQDLSHNGVAARAVVKSTEQHNGVCYTFVDASLQPRSGCSFAHYPGEDAATLHVGQTIDIVY